MARYSIGPGVSVSTSGRNGQSGRQWVAEAVSGPWETGSSEAEAIGKLMVSIATSHTPECRRPWHRGPCRTALSSERPETPHEAYERHVDAVEAVLRRACVPAKVIPADSEDAVLRELAEALLAAADVGF